MDVKPPFTRWGSYDHLVGGQACNPPVHSPGLTLSKQVTKNVEDLEKEVDNLKDIVTQQNVIIQKLDNKLLTPTQKATGGTKPRDVPILELDQLQGLNATTQLQIFFELIEQCSDNELRRVQIAKARVSSELAALIHNHQTHHQCNTWKDFKQLLTTEFSTDVNFDRAWQEIDSVNYDWAQSPQAFTNNFICQYAILETRFAQEKLPDRDKIIKKKLWQGLTPESKARLEGFLDETYPLSKFIDRVEHERQWLEAKQTVPLYRVKDEGKQPTQLRETNEKCTPNREVTGTETTPSECSEVEQLKAQIRDLTKQVQQLHTQPRQSPPTKYCSHCRSHSHNLRECWRKPTRGTCFDCKRYGCWRGNQNCPGPTNNRT